jgi:hypothetical protein
VRLLGLIALMTVAGLVAACGGGDGHAAAPGTPQNPLIAKPTQDTDTCRSNEASAGGSTQPGYQKLVERQTSRPASRFTPCNLVTRAQASAIIGGPVMAPVEAPQGPTCIYRSAQKKAFVTLAVQKLDVGRLRKQMHRPHAVGISDHTAFCGTYGQQVLYVSLSRGRVLSVGAPCPLAKGFAVRAVARLGG